MKVLSKILLVVTLSVFCVSCSQDLKSTSKDEGIIEFDTKAVDKNDPLYSLAPGSGTLKFKGQRFAMELSVMGVFKTSFIGNTKEKTLTQMVKFMDVKQACIENENDVLEENKAFPLKIEETTETKKIIGLSCLKAKATKINDPAAGSFDVWYTKELGLPDCNVLTPYAQLKGVLLDYHIKKMGLELHFKATSFKNVQVDDLAFAVPANIKIVSKEEMASFFAGLQ